MTTSTVDNSGTPDSQRADATMVASALAGDRQAMAAIYDTYADRVHTMCVHMLGDRDEAADVCGEVFLVAFQKLPQLRDPSRLKPWLFAICRHEVYRRTKRRRRIELVEEVSDMDRMHPIYDDHDNDESTGVLATAALGQLVQDAAAGLDDRDRLVLELQLQGLEGDDLAAALGTSTSTSYQHVHRMRERMERSLGAVLIARQGRSDCADLDRLLAGWDGQFSVIWRKRVARHVDGCQVCERRRKAIPATLLGGAAGASPLVVVPTSVRQRVLDSAVIGGPGTAGGSGRWQRDGFPPGDSTGRRTIAVAAVLALILVLIGGFAARSFFADDQSVATSDLSAASGTTTTSAGSTTTGPSTTTSTSDPAPTTTAFVVVPTTLTPTTATPTTPTSTRPAPTTTRATATTVTTAAPTTTAPATTTTVKPPTLRLLATGSRDALCGGGERWCMRQ